MRTDGTRGSRPRGAPTIALLPWGSTIEEWLEPLGVSVHDLPNAVIGNWVFGYVQVLRKAGLQTLLIAPSRRVSRRTEFLHEPTKATIVLLPSPPVFRAARRATAASGALSQQYLHEVVENRRTAFRAAGMYLATPLLGVAGALRRYACQGVLCQEYEHPRFDQCVALGRLLRIPVFGTFQGGSATSLLERAVRRWAISSCNGLIIPARSEVQRVLSRYSLPPARVGHIWNPIDLAVWRPYDRMAARAELGIPQDARAVAWHGQVDVHRKGLDVLVEGWARLSRIYPEEKLVLLLVGTGRDAHDLRRRLARDDLEEVRWEEAFVHDQHRLARLLSAADVYVFPSRREGLPAAPMEAMACGLPLVAADAPGAADILGGGAHSGGLLVPPGDPRALAEALRDLLADDERRSRMGTEARRHVEESASLDAVAEQLRAFLLGRGVRGLAGGAPAAEIPA